MNCSFKIAHFNAITNYVKKCYKNIFHRQKTFNKVSKYYKVCSAYLGAAGSSTNKHCHLCDDTNINKSSKILPNFVYPKCDAKNSEVYHIITSQCKNLSDSKGYKKYVSGCSKDNNILKNTTRINHNTTFDRCIIETNISLIFVVNLLRENKFAPDEVLKMPLNTTLSFRKVDLDLEASESNSCYQTCLYFNQVQCKRNILLSFGETYSYITLLG